MQHLKVGNGEFNMQTWVGKAVIRPKIGAFYGFAGDNALHRHWVHQLSFGLADRVRIETDGAKWHGAGFVIQAGTYHRLLPGKVLSIYIDPVTETGRAVSKAFQPAPASPVLPLENQLVKTILDRLDQIPLDEILDGFLERPGDAVSRPRDPRLLKVIEALTSLGFGERLSRNQLALVAGVSEGRFSHWFREQTGLPARSYRKWLCLIRGIEEIRVRKTLTEVAHAAGFSDHSHFTRTCVDMFGITPSNLLHLIDPD